ncbi:MAG: RsmE family RNA methyltransferase [Planctomycetota bacterium]
MTQRYYAPDLGDIFPDVTLSTEESTHATRVMRVVEGDHLTLFDGQGRQANGHVIDANRRACVVRCQSLKQIDRMPGRKLIMAVAMPKADRAKDMIERLTELGVTHVIPVVFEHSQRAPSDGLLNKLRRASLESCKQCGRNSLMQISSPRRFRDILSDEAPIRLLASPAAPAASWQVLQATQPTQVLIGPEGGLSACEVAQARQHGFDEIGLGGRVLRIETAAMTLAARLLWD